MDRKRDAERGKVFSVCNINSEIIVITNITCYRAERRFIKTK